MRLTVITCGSKKRTVSAPAKDLYIGAYFKTQLEWALATNIPGRVRILSAKHGLLKLGDIIDPYELHISDSSLTGASLAKQIPTGCIIETTAGHDYIPILREAGEIAGAEVYQLFTGYPWIGPKMAAIKKATNLTARTKK